MLAAGDADSPLGRYLAERPESPSSGDYGDFAFSDSDSDARRYSDGSQSTGEGGEGKGTLRRANSDGGDGDRELTRQDSGGSYGDFNFQSDDSGTPVHTTASAIALSADASCFRATSRRLAPPQPPPSARLPFPQTALAGRL